MLANNVVVVLLLLLSISATSYTLDITDAIDASYVKCITLICKYYFRTEHAMKGSLVIMNVTPMPSMFQSRIIGSFDEDLVHQISVMVKSSHRPHLNASHVSDKAQNYFMFCESAATDVNSTVRQWYKLPTWNPMAQVVVLFTQTYDTDADADILQEEIDTVLRILHSYGMLNVNVLVDVDRLNIVQVYTWYPYSHGNCAKELRQVVVADECSYRTAPGIAVHYTPSPKVPKIPATLHGCPLRVSSSVWEPYSVYDSTAGSFRSGIEVLLIDTIAAVLRLSAEFVLLAENRENRVAGQPNDGYALLANRTSDILIGGMDEDTYTRKHLSASIPYYQDDQTWCVAVAKAEDLWRSFFGLFSLKEWAVITFMVWLIAFILYFVSRSDGRRETMPWMLLSSLSICLGLTTVYEPRRSTVRFMFWSFLFYGLIFSSAFHSFLVNVLSNPKQKPQVDTLESAVANGFRLSGGQLPLSHYDANDAMSVHVRGTYTQCKETDVCLTQLLHDDELAVSVAREHALNSPVIGNADMFCFTKTHNVYSYSVTLLAQRNYHLLGRMNSIIRRVMEFGLIEKWERDSDHLQELQLQMKHTGNSGGVGEGDAVVLKVEHIMGALILMGVGYSVALVTFVAECAMNAKWAKVRCFWVWRAIDALLNGQRYIWN